MSSPETVVPAIVAVVVELPVCANNPVNKAGTVVRSAPSQIQPFGADSPVAPFIVMTTVQVPVVPDVKWPIVAPPSVAEFEHPEAVNFVPPEIYPAAVTLAPVFPDAPVPNAKEPAAARETDVSRVKSVYWVLAENP